MPDLQTLVDLEAEIGAQIERTKIRRWCAGAGKIDD
jgi:hypothetical protein